MSDEHERIWLAPRCCADPDTGRHWAQDPSPWPCPDCTSNSRGVEYVRADLVAALRARAEQADAPVRTARAEALREAVEIIRSRVQVRIEPHFRAAASKIEAGIAGGMAAMADDVAAAISDLIMRTVPKEKPDEA